ncbi:putative Smooth muscle caldesmon [Balamuthia mandrillaris]
MADQKLRADRRKSTRQAQKGTFDFWHKLDREASSRTLIANKTAQLFDAKKETKKTEASPPTLRKSFSPFVLRRGPSKTSSSSSSSYEELRSAKKKGSNNGTETQSKQKDQQRGAKNKTTNNKKQKTNKEEEKSSTPKKKRRKQKENEGGSASSSSPSSSPMITTKGEEREERQKRRRSAEISSLRPFGAETLFDKDKEEETKEIAAIRTDFYSSNFHHSLPVLKPSEQQHPIRRSLLEVQQHWSHVREEEEWSKRWVEEKRKRANVARALRKERKRREEAERELLLARKENEELKSEVERLLALLPSSPSSSQQKEDEDANEKSKRKKKAGATKTSSVPSSPRSVSLDGGTGAPSPLAISAAATSLLTVAQQENLRSTLMRRASMGEAPKKHLKMKSSGTTMAPPKMQRKGSSHSLAVANKKAGVQKNDSSSLRTTTKAGRSLSSSTPSELNANNEKKKNNNNNKPKQKKKGSSSDTENKLQLSLDVSLLPERQRRASDKTTPTTATTTTKRKSSLERSSKTTRRASLSAPLDRSVLAEQEEEGRVKEEEEEEVEAEAEKSEKSVTEGDEQEDTEEDLSIPSPRIQEITGGRIRVPSMFSHGSKVSQSFILRKADDQQDGDSSDGSGSGNGDRKKKWGEVYRQKSKDDLHLLISPKKSNRSSSFTEKSDGEASSASSTPRASLDEPTRSFSTPSTPGSKDKKPKKKWKRRNTAQNLHTVQSERSMGLMEERLSTLLEARPTRSQLVKQNLLEGSVFGVALENMIIEQGEELPWFIKESVNLLKRKVKTKDLFIAEENDHKERQKLLSLKESINAGSKNREELESIEPVMLAELLKLFLKELPEPLIPASLYNSFIDAAEIKFHTFRVNALHSLLFTMPKLNRDVLREITSLLSEVSKQKANGVTTGKLTPVFGPLLLRPEQLASSSSASPDVTRKGAASRDVSFASNILTIPDSNNDKSSNRGSSILEALQQDDKNTSTEKEKGKSVFSELKARADETATKKSAAVVHELLLEHELLFFQIDKHIKFQMKDGKLLVKACTLEKLVEKMVDENYQEVGFVEIVFFTHTYFTTSVILLKKLISLYNKNNTLPNLGSRNWQHKLRIRVLTLLKNWIVTYFYELGEDQEFTTLLQGFADVRPGLKGKSSTILEEESIFGFIRVYMASLEQKKLQKKQELRSISFYKGIPGVNMEALREKNSKNQRKSKGGIGASRRERKMEKKREKEEKKREKKERERKEKEKKEKERKEKEEQQRKKKEQSEGKACPKAKNEKEEREDKNAESGTETKDDEQSEKENETEEGETEGEDSPSLHSEQEDPTTTPTTLTTTSPTGTTITGMNPQQLAAEKLEFLSLSAQELAQQLTLIDHELFKVVPSKELVKKRFMDAETSPHFTALVNRFNLTGQWVGTELAKYPTPAERAQVLAHFIEICQECYDMNSFNSVFALLAGLNNTAISRLKQSWEKIPKKVMKKYHNLMTLVDTDKNYQTYRQTLVKTKPPLVPYLALFSKDLFSVEEGNPTMLEDEMVNFEKMRMLHKIAQDFASYQVQYPIPMDPMLRAYLKGTEPLSEKELYDMSYRYEPRVTTS